MQDPLTKKTQRNTGLYSTFIRMANFNPSDIQAGVKYDGWSSKHIALFKRHI